jgi:hypothetical protein
VFVICRAMPLANLQGLQNQITPARGRCYLGMDARCSYGRRERSRSDGRAQERRGAEFGDTGALVTGDPRLAARVRALREHGQNAKHRHEAVGYMARLDTVQAAVLLRKLPLLPEWTEERRSIASAYSEDL